MGKSPTEITLGNGFIHIVDDDQDIVTVATRALEHNGYRVHSFTNSKEALADIESNCRELVRMLITDIQMPDHSGFEVARRTRAVVPNAPVIFMSAHELNPSEFDAVFPSIDGMSEFLQKPITMKKLLETIRRYDVRQ